MPYSLLDSPITTTILMIIVSTITGIVTWLFGRRRSEVEITEIATKTYSMLVSDLRIEISDLREVQDAQEKKIKRRDEELERIFIYVERLEDLLIKNNIIKRVELEAIKAEIGI